MKNKERTTLTGTLLRPLAVGTNALIRRRWKIMRTSKVVAIHSVGANEICFETRNAHYRLLPPTRPQAQTAARPFTMMAA